MLPAAVTGKARPIVCYRRRIPLRLRIARQRTAHRNFLFLAHVARVEPHYLRMRRAARIYRYQTARRNFVTTAQLAAFLTHVARAQAHTRQRRLPVPVRRRPLIQVQSLLALIRRRALRAKIRQRAIVRPPLRVQRRIWPMLVSRLVRKVSRVRQRIQGFKQRLRSLRHNTNFQPPPPTLFFDGVEGGDFGPYVGAFGSIAVSTAKPRSGTYSIACTAVGAYTYPPSWPPQVTVYVRAYVYIHGMSANITGQHAQIIQPFAFGGVNVSAVNVVTDGSGNPSLSITNYGSGSAVDNGTTIPVNADTWILVELKTVIATGTAGIIELKINGVVRLSWTGISTGANLIASCYFAFYDTQGGGSATGTIYIDDILVSTVGYPGPGICRKVQATATAPTYDTYTKSTAGAINTVWDDTPFSATTYAFSTTSGGQQTGVMDATGFLNSGDAVNSVKIAAVGKTSMASDTSDSVIFRTGGVDTIIGLGAGWGTTDSYQEVYFTGITAPQYRNHEAGVQHAVNTNTHTIEDLWSMVDFTPLEFLSPRFRRWRPIPGIKRIYRKPERWIRYPTGLPFVHIARGVRRTKVQAARKLRIRGVRRQLALFTLLRHATSRAKIRQSSIRIKSRQLRHIASPLATVFRVAQLKRKALRFPLQRYNRPKAERWVRYPTGLSFIHVARLGRKALRFARQVAIKPRGFWHVHYPIGAPFFRLARGIKRIPLRRVVMRLPRPANQHIRQLFVSLRHVMLRIKSRRVATQLRPRARERVRLLLAASRHIALRARSISAVRRIIRKRTEYRSILTPAQLAAFYMILSRLHPRRIMIPPIKRIWRQRTERRNFVTPGQLSSSLMILTHRARIRSRRFPVSVRPKLGRRIGLLLALSRHRVLRARSTIKASAIRPRSERWIRSLFVSLRHGALRARLRRVPIFRAKLRVRTAKLILGAWQNLPIIHVRRYRPRTVPVFRDKPKVHHLIWQAALRLARSTRRVGARRVVTQPRLRVGVRSRLLLALLRHRAMRVAQASARRIVKVRQQVRHVYYPTGLSFIHIARAIKHARIFPRIKAVIPRPARHIRQFVALFAGADIAIRIKRRSRIFPRIKAVIPRPARHIRQFIATQPYIARIRARRRLIIKAVVVPQRRRLRLMRATLFATVHRITSRPTRLRPIRIAHRSRRVVAVLLINIARMRRRAPMIQSTMLSRARLRFRHIFYPIGLPFMRLVRGRKFAWRRVKLATRPKAERWIRLLSATLSVHLARARKLILRGVPQIRAPRRVEHVRAAVATVFTMLVRGRQTRHSSADPTSRNRPARKIRAALSASMAIALLRRRRYKLWIPTIFRRLWRRVWLPRGLPIPGVPPPNAPRIFFVNTLDPVIHSVAPLDNVIRFDARML